VCRLLGRPSSFSKLYSSPTPLRALWRASLFRYGSVSASRGNESLYYEPEKPFAPQGHALSQPGPAVRAPRAEVSTRVSTWRIPGGHKNKDVLIIMEKSVPFYPGRQKSTLLGRVPGGKPGISPDLAPEGQYRSRSGYTYPLSKGRDPITAMQVFYVRGIDMTTARSLSFSHTRLVFRVCSRADLRIQRR